MLTSKLFSAWCLSKRNPKSRHGNAFLAYLRFGIIKHLQTNIFKNNNRSPQSFFGDKSTEKISRKLSQKTLKSVINWINPLRKSPENPKKNIQNSKRLRWSLQRDEVHGNLRLTQHRMRVGPTEAEGGQGSSATPVERHVLALEDLAGIFNGIFMGFSMGFSMGFQLDCHGISWDFNGISWDFHWISMGF